MENILLFLLTVAVYSTVICWFFRNDWTRYIKRLAFVALLALPINIGGNVFTIAGNAVAEKNIYSLFSFYQRAGQNASTGFGLTYQQARQNAMTIFGLAYQQAGQDAVTGIGLAYQQAGQNAVTILGLVYQQAGQDAVTGIGLTYQKAGSSARVPISIAIYQRVGEKTRAFGAFSSLTKN